MSPSNNQTPTATTADTADASAEPSAAEIIAAFEEPPKKPKKKLSKKAKIALILSAWIVLVGGAVGLAFLLRPAAEVAHLAPVVEEFEWQEPANVAELDLVDVDYYGYYNANSLSFEKATEDYTSPYSGIMYVRGLKNKAVENKINTRIKAIANELIPKLKNEYGRVSMSLGANLYNVLSFYFTFNNYENSVSHYYTYGATFDLNTGDELSFDDIFIDNFDYAQYVQKAFYDHLSVNLALRGQSIAHTIASYEKDPTSCNMYSVTCNVDDPAEAIKPYYAERDAIQSNLANIEQYSASEAKKYLEGDKPFYLNAYGPAFIFNDHESVAGSEAKDQAKYLAFYRDYKTTSSLFENDSLGAKHIFYTTWLSLNEGSSWDISETGSYLLEQYNFREEFPEKAKLHRDYLLSRIMKKIEAQPQFYWVRLASTVYRAGSSGRKYNYYIASADVAITTTSQDYYNSAFRKAIIDGKTQNAAMGMFQPARVGHYDAAKVQNFTQSDLNSFIGGGLNALIDEDGNLYAQAEDIFNPESDWQEYLKNYFYAQVGHYSSGTFIRDVFTDAEKATHDIGVVMNGSTLFIGIKDSNADNPNGFSKQTYLPIYYIPNEYLKPPFWH